MMIYGLVHNHFLPGFLYRRSAYRPVCACTLCMPFVSLFASSVVQQSVNGDVTLARYAPHEA